MPFLPSSLSGTPGVVSYFFPATLFWLPLPGLWLPSSIPTLRQTPPRNFSPRSAQKLLDGRLGVFSEYQIFFIETKQYIYKLFIAGGSKVLFLPEYGL